MGRTRKISDHVVSLVRLYEHRPDQSQDAGFIGDDADHIGLALDLLVELLQCIAQTEASRITKVCLHLG